MKSIRIFALLVALSAGAWIAPQDASAQQRFVSFGVFYDELSPYGMWVNYPPYGFVWIPDSDPDFSPYASAGYWVYTDDGWMWVSDYPWGWAAFHYGRWDYADPYGWFWVPDDVWGPAWVSWRRSPGYYGWAPLRPGISITIAFGRDYREQNERWIFVRDRDITRSDIGRYYVNRTNNVTIINNSTVIVNTRNDSRRNATYIAGPNREDVQRVTRTTVKPVTLRDTDRPGHRLSNGELQIYRPQVQKMNRDGREPAPSKVVRLSDVRPASERNSARRQQQSRTVNPANQSQPSRPQAVSPPDNRGKQQPRAVTPPSQRQPSQPPAVSPADNREKQQQLRRENPPDRMQTSQPRDVSPSNSKEGQRQLRTADSPARVQPSQPREVKPSNTRGKDKQPQTVVPPKKKDNPEPKARQDEKGKKKE